MGTVREPLLVLDRELRVLAASRSFYLTFKVARPTPRAKYSERDCMNGMQVDKMEPRAVPLARNPLPVNLAYLS